MKSLFAALAFCTRIPISFAFGAEDVGKAARWFPLIGALLGVVSIALSRLLLPIFPASIVAVLILVAEALLTGALHMDGLADTADGFGGGKTREDVLRIMRDHAIGSYGATTLILLFALKATAISTLISRNAYSPFLALAPALGRWNIVLLSRWLPYARTSEAVSRHIGRREMVWATALTTVIAAGWANWRGMVCWGAAALVAVLWGLYCKRKIGGATGDTLGASEQIGESIVLLVGVALR
jgi:adenosylcobinamide-GDP ribazoletransferase